jgi:hypothetical protein
MLKSAKLPLVLVFGPRRTELQTQGQLKILTKVQLHNVTSVFWRESFGIAKYGFFLIEG